jgi:hypothetical protein
MFGNRTEGSRQLCRRYWKIVRIVVPLVVIYFREGVKRNDDFLYYVAQRLYNHNDASSNNIVLTNVSDKNIVVVLLNAYK